MSESDLIERKIIQIIDELTAVPNQKIRGRKLQNLENAKRMIDEIAEKLKHD